MGFWDKIKQIFLKSERDNLEKEVEKEKLEYTGYEPDCWACGYPIHHTHKSRKITGNKVHNKCYKKLKKILFSGKDLSSFS